MPAETQPAIWDAIAADEVAQVCSDLVQLNTANPPGRERLAAEYIAAYLAPAGYTCDYVAFPGEEGRESIVCRLAAGPATSRRTNRSALMFNGHLDVVPIGGQPWTHGAFAGEIAEGRVWGRGSSDMKGGVAAMLVAARTLGLARPELQGDVIVAATAGEEAGMQGATAVANWPALGPIGVVIIAEPTGNTLGLAERGVIWAEFETYGKTAHGSTPQLGRNAVNAMRRLLDEFDRLAIPFTHHPLLGDLTTSLNMMSGGTAPNVVPDRCRAVVDMRTVPGQEARVILRQFEEMIARLAAADPTFSASVSTPYVLPAVDTPSDAPAVESFRNAVQMATGRPLVDAVVRFATEAAIFMPVLNVPVIIYGPGDPGLAHQPDEYAEIPKLVEAARVYVAAALQILG